MRYPDRQDRRGRPALAAPAAAPARPLRRLLVVFAAILGFVAVLVYPAASSATDLELVFCTSSIDPKCQPGNIPILIEAGIISGGGTTTTTATVAGGTAVAALPIAPGPFAWLLGGATTVVGADLALNQNGLTGGRIKTDPNYATEPGDAICDNVVPGGYFVSYSQLLAADATCSAMPMTNLSPPYYARNQLVELTHDGPGVALGKAYVDYQVAGWENLAPDHGGRLNLQCRNTTTGVRYEQSVPIYSSAGVLQNGSGRLECDTAPTSIDLVYWSSSNAAGSGTLYGVVTDYTGTIGAPAPGGNTIEGTIGGSVSCVGPDGVIYQRGINASINVTAGQDVVIPDVRCNGGDLAVETELDWTPAGSETPTSIVPPTAPLPQITELPGQYPDCFGAGALACKLTLWRLGTGGQLDSCGTIGQLCEGWAQHPTPAELYKCKYGPYDVDLRACSAYRAPSTGVLPNVDQEGNWLPINHPVPQPLPNDTGTGTAPTTVPFPADGFRDAEGNPTNCWPTGWGVFNPYAWVYQPMMCAALALFIPRQTVLQQIATDTRDAYAGSIIGHGFEAGDQILNVLPQGVSIDCAGPPVIFGGPLNDLGISGTYFPLNSCSEPMSTFRTIAYWALPAFTLFGLLFALTRYVAAIIGFVGAGSTNETAEWERKVKFS